MRDNARSLSSPPPTLVCASSSLSSSLPSSHQRFPSPHRSRGRQPSPSRDKQPPGDCLPRIGRRQRDVVLASPRSRDPPRSDSSSDVIAPQFIIGGGAVPTVVVVVATAPTTAPPPDFKLIVVLLSEGSWVDGGEGPVGGILCSGGGGEEVDG